MGTEIKTYLVNKSNVLINSRYSLSLNEQRLILILASLVQPSDEDFKEYEIRVDDFSEIMGLNEKTKSSYSEMAKLTKELMGKTFEIITEKSKIQVNWLSSCEYINGSGTVLLEFSPKLKPYLLKLKGNFTSYSLSNILRMKSKYSIRLYEILRSNLYKGSYTITIDELRYMLKAEHYSAWGNFKQRIFDDRKPTINKKTGEKEIHLGAINEINAKTDIFIDYVPIKEGNKYTKIRFTIKSSAAIEAKSNNPLETKEDVKFAIGNGIIG